MEVECLYISPETKYIHPLHRRFSVKDLVDAISISKSLSDVFTTYYNMLHFESMHNAMSTAKYTSRGVSIKEELKMDKDEFINVPALMLMSPLQIMTSIKYYDQRKDPYMLNLGPVIKCEDVEEDASKCGWCIEYCKVDI